MAATMAHDIRNDFGTTWSFEKAILESDQRSPSENSSADFSEAQEKFRITPKMEDIKQTIVEQKSPALFNERYMSSEEQLSPTEHDSDTGPEDDDSIFELGIAAPLRFTVCDMAIAICIIAVGKPKVVNIPLPSLNSSPSIGSGSEYGRASWMPKRRSASSVPLKPILRQRNPNRPNLTTLYSAPSLSDIRTTTTAATASTTTHTSPALSSSSDTPPTSSYTDSIGHDSRRSSLFRANSTTNSPKKEFTINRSSTMHSFLEHDPYETTSPPSHRRHSRFRNLSQKIKLPRFGKSNKSVEEEHNQREERPFSPRPMSMIFSQTPPRRRMVARGAAEREPTIEIPPCPYDLDDDGGLILDKPMRRRRSIAF
jgi:hypothetical protein